MQSRPENLEWGIQVQQAVPLQSTLHISGLPMESVTLSRQITSYEPERVTP